MNASWNSESFATLSDETIVMTFASTLYTSPTAPGIQWVSRNALFDFARYQVAHMDKVPGTQDMCTERGQGNRGKGGDPPNPPDLPPPPPPPTNGAVEYSIAEEQE